MKVIKKFCEKLINSKDNTEAYIGFLLNEIREVRNFADYDWIEKDENYYFDNVVHIKNNVINALESLESSK